MWQILIIILCILFNAILSATELAFVSISKTHLRMLARAGDQTAAGVVKLRENPERTLSVLQLGITFVGIIAASVGAVGVDEWLAPYFRDQIGLSPGMSQLLVIVIFVIPYTYLNVLFSELLPKSLAFRNPKRVIFHTSRWLKVLGSVLAPAVYVLEKSTKFGVRLFSGFFKSEEPVEEPISVGRLLRPYMVKLAEMEKKTVTDAMVPWQETVTVDINDPVEKVEQVLLDSGHTRLPILEEGKPVGLLHSKEFVVFRRNGEGKWQSLIREINFVSKSDILIFALRLMQRKHSHLCIVMEKEEPMGIVTIEDIIEEVVGEIYDEDDEVEK